MRKISLASFRQGTEKALRILNQKSRAPWVADPVALLNGGWHVYLHSPLEEEVRWAVFLQAIPTGQLWKVFSGYEDATGGNRMYTSRRLSPEEAHSAITWDALTWLEPFLNGVYTQEENPEPEAYRCQACGQRLRPWEGDYYCIDCAIAQAEGLLASPQWTKVRGPYMAKDIRQDLANLYALREAYSR